MARYPKKFTDNSYDTLILEVAEDVCKEHSAPIAADYERAVAKLICIKKERDDYITARQIHTAIRNHLIEMAKNKDLISDGKHYWTYNAYLMYTGEKAFIENVIPSKNMPSSISYNVFAIALEHNTDNNSAKQAVLNFVGYQNVYSLFICDDTLIIILEDHINDSVRDKIYQIVKRAYVYHHGN